jgi:methionyl-tRNA formyltransferase
MKIVFFGSSRNVTPVLEMLHNNFKIALAVTTEQGGQDVVPFFCKTKKIDYISVGKSANLISNNQITNLKPDLGIVADFGLIIPPETLRNFSFGMVNIHPSLLPKYRGPSPAQAAILNGDKKTGVTIIELDKYMDHGPIIEQKQINIENEDTAKSLYEKLFKLGSSILLNVINNYEVGNIHSKPQDHSEATFTKFLTRDDGYLDLQVIASNPDFFEKMVRAYYPWPGVWTKAKLNEEAEKIIKFLPQKRIKVEGGREMSYRDFVNGYSDANKILLDFLRKDENG